VSLKKLTAVDFIVVHCSATGPKQDIGALEIDQWHRKRGWIKIGYHLVIRRNGAIEPGRELDEQGAHVTGRNSNTLGVCLVGGINADGKAEDNYTPAQHRQLLFTLRALKARHPNAQIVGHRDLSPDLNGDGFVTRHEWVKECPSFDVKAWAAKHGL
jgi:N-acetylmuramoyl-L-alanine amidase